MSARVSSCQLAASVALLADGYDERSSQANIQYVENPHRSSCVMVPPGNNKAHDATGATSAQHVIHWCDEVGSKMRILPVATSSSRRIDPAQPAQLQRMSRINNRQSYSVNLVESTCILFIQEGLYIDREPSEF